MEFIFFKKCHLCESENIKIWDKDNNIFQCNDCDFVFDNPRPSFEDIFHYYSRPTKYDKWISDLPQREALWKRRLKKMKKMVASGSLLDIGSGIGQFLNYAQNDFYPVIGTEISDTAIEIAKEKFSITLMKGGIEDIKFEKSFDIITLFHVLEHVENPKRTVKKIHQLLTTGGIVFIAVPNDVSSLKQRVKRIVKAIAPSKILGFGISGLPKITLDDTQGEIHLSHFKPHVLKLFLEVNGFSILEESLDPFFVSRGWRRLLDEVYYRFNMVLFTISGKNLYDTIWIAAKKK